MELINPDEYYKIFDSKSTEEVLEEKKKIENKLAEIDASKSMFAKKEGPSIQEQNAITPFSDAVYGKDLEEDKRVKVMSEGEHSEISLYMSYQRALNRILNSRNPLMNTAQMTQEFRSKTVDELMTIRNGYVEDINKYRKENNQMRTKMMLLSIPFTRWLVKDKNVNNNEDVLEVIMKKEEYITLIDTIMDEKVKEGLNNK